MPTRTIYVRHEDLATWEKAQACAKGRSLSSIVLEGLHLFIQATSREDGNADGKPPHETGPADAPAPQAMTARFGPVSLAVREWGAEMHVRFHGLYLTTVGLDGGVRYALYLTRKGRFLVYCDRAKEGADYRVFHSLTAVAQATDGSRTPLYPPLLVKRAIGALEAVGAPVDLDI